MARLIDVGLDKLRGVLLGMADLSERSVATSIHNYIANSAESEQVHKWSEMLRSLEEEVSEVAVELIARYQPVASDLRFIKSCMEVAYGFSRFGRYAYDISEVLAVVGDISTCDKSDVIEAGKQTQEMIRLSIKAFTKTDTETAREVKRARSLAPSPIVRMKNDSTFPGIRPTVKSTAISGRKTPRPTSRIANVRARPGAPATTPAANRYHGSRFTRAQRRASTAGSTRSQREGGA